MPTSTDVAGPSSAVDGSSSVSIFSPPHRMMDNSLGYFKSLLVNDIVLDGTLSFDNSLAPHNLDDHDSLIEVSRDGASIEPDISIQPGDDEIECSSGSSEDLEEEDFSDFDDDVSVDVGAEHDGGLASIAAAVQVGKSQKVDGEFVNDPMSFNADQSWLATYKAADMVDEGQFAVHGPPNANGQWKGLIFSKKEALTMALEEWHVIHFVQMKVKKSDTYRYTCVCVESNCRWRLHAHRPKGSTYFLVSQYKGSHNCVIPIGHSMHRNCSSALICEKILPSMRASLSMTVKEIQLKIKGDWKTDISYELAWKARSRALRIIYGSWERSFSDLPMYLSMMQASNPGTIWTMNPLWTGRTAQQFKRIFWAFGPSIEGWKNCRPVISVDGTHLYGKYEGHALFATGIDANGGLYPIAFAIRDKENGDNWKWFLQSLREFVTRERNVCIISDRFSRNKEVVRRVFSPNDGGRRYGVMTTNWSESLNSVLQGTRSLPITAFVAATFYRVNQAFVDRREEGGQITTQLCPKALDKIRPRQLASRGYQVSRFGLCKFEVNTGNSTYSVTINGKSSECVCQAFRLIGLPCSHMLASCGEQWHGTDFHTLCDIWYFTEMYRNAYAIQFHPVPDKRYWSSFEGPVVLPPALRKKKGRPKSTRIHNSTDARKRTSTSKRKCSNCNELGHYKERCPQLRKSFNPGRTTRGATS